MKFVRALFSLYKVDLIIALDMFSSGYPAVLAGKLFGKKTILRVGGDFLWETYVEKTGHLIKMPDFYAGKMRLSFKHKIIKQLQKFTLENAGALAFNSDWQRQLFIKFYNLSGKKLRVIENYYGEKAESDESAKGGQEYYSPWLATKTTFGDTPSACGGEIHFVRFVKSVFH